MHQPQTKTLIALTLVFIMVFSFFVLGKILSSPDAMAGTVRSIDEKTETVLKLTATTTLASAAVSAIPQDTATPIAEKLADFTEYFLLILCVLYTEKYLITILGAAVFKILIPMACLVLLGGLYLDNTRATKLAVKLGVVGLALYFLIPCSILVSDLIYDTYKTSIDTAIASAEALTDETDAFGNQEGENSHTGLFASLTGAIDQLRSRAANILRQFVETLAILIVTSCLIPLLSLVFFLWLLRQLTGLDILTRFGSAGEHRQREAGHKETHV